MCTTNKKIIYHIILLFTMQHKGEQLILVILNLLLKNVKLKDTNILESVIIQKHNFSWKFHGDLKESQSRKATLKFHKTLKIRIVFRVTETGIILKEWIAVLSNDIKFTN